jgi:hypothetical protein
MLEQQDYLAKLKDFIGRQDYLKNVQTDSLSAGSKRSDLGITSLDVIMIVANYMESSGGNGTFHPDWISKLDDVGGIIEVLREIDAIPA